MPHAASPVAAALLLLLPAARAAPSGASFGPDDQFLYSISNPQSPRGKQHCAELDNPGGAGSKYWAAKGWKYSSPPWSAGKCDRSHFNYVNKVVHDLDGFANVTFWTLGIQVIDKNNSIDAAAAAGTASAAPGRAVLSPRASEDDCMSVACCADSQADCDNGGRAYCTNPSMCGSGGNGVLCYSRPCTGSGGDDCSC
jgi:hypothetical protein